MTSMLITNAHILTMDSQRSVAESMLVEDGLITAVGTNLEIARYAPPTADRLDARGQTILPGFIDAHTHLELTTYSEFFWRNVKLFSVEETLATLREETKRTPSGEWVVLQATFGQELPTLEQLDRIAPRHPVAIRWTMHKFQLNTPALNRCSLTPSTALPPGVRLGAAADGSLNGIVEEGWDLLDWEHPLAEALEAVAVTPNLFPAPRSHHDLRGHGQFRGSEVLSTPGPERKRSANRPGVHRRAGPPTHGGHRGFLAHGHGYGLWFGSGVGPSHQGIP